MIRHVFDAASAVAPLARWQYGSYGEATMLAAIGARLDRRVSVMLISRVRRRWPLMRVVPAAVMMPLLAPVARRVRSSVVRVAALGVLAASVVAAAILAATA
jgi:hypothetical protein